MVLPVLLTSENLRAAAGGAFARGEAYWREGRVLSCVLDKDALDGLVRGTEEYRVRVSALSGTLVSHCTCPVREAVCKHAVALSLSFLAQRGAGGEPSSEAVTPGPSEGVFATRAELDRWAEAHHVKHALAVSAGGLLQDLAINEAQRNGLRHVLGGLALRDVGSREGALRHVGARGRGLETALAEAAAAYLRQEADSVRSALCEEAVRREHHGDALLAPLWGRLLEVRRALRLHAVPRSHALRALESWSFDVAACALTWKERDRVVRGGPDYGTVAVSARLAFPGGGEGRWECNCATRQRGCVHVLALVDTLLDVLSDTTRLADARRLAEELLRPSWARALKELELFEEEAAKPRATVEVWWFIEHELGTLTVSPLVKKQTRRGTLSAGARMTAARLLEEHRESLCDADLRIAEHLVSWSPTSSRAAGTYPSRAFLSLAGHPRVALELRPDVPLEMKRVQLGFTALAAAEHIRLEPSIEGERFNPKLLSALLRTFSLGEPLFTVEEQRGRCLLIDVNEEARRIWAVLEKHGDQFPPESHGPLLERLSRLEARLPLVVPQALKGRELQTEVATVVRLRLLPDVSLELELLVRPGPGAPLFHPGVGPRDVLLSRGGERGYVRRQLLREEERARAAIAPLPLSAAEEGPPFCFRIGETEAALELVAALQAPPAGLEVEWVDEKPVIAAPAGPEALRVQVERKRDWFGLSGELKVEAGRLELAVLLDAARRQKRFVRVDAHRWVELSETLRQRLLAVADHAFVGKSRIELSPGAVPAISALRDAGADVETAPAWQLLTERLAASLSLKPKPPASLGTTLRDYQAEGHAWLSRVAAWGAGACLADDMGLGKTVQALAVLLDRARLGPALVLAPTSVAFNWVQEIQRFAPNLRPVLYAEQAERMACLTKLRKSDVLIVSYGLLVRDAASLGEVQFATLVVDEAQALKNPSTRRARAARQLKAGFRIALSGTPLENHLGELWSLFAIVFPGLLGSWEQFRERFAAPIERGKEPEANAALSRVLRPFLLRRTKQEVARELPSRTEIQVPVALSEEEWTLYEDARLAAVAEVSAQGKGLRDEQQRFQVLAALTRLRLLASHPRLYDAQSSVSSAKMRRLLELLEELKSEGHRALVFSQFTSHLALVREEVERAGFTYQYLDGATPPTARAKRIQAFQEGEGDLFLISLKAGGTGINLTAADYVIHLDPWWNPAVEDQATDRAHRIGQTRPVTVYRLIARGTIEEQILSLHSDKRALVAGVLEGTNAAARLTTKDLLTLLAGGTSVRDMQGDEEDPGPRTVH
ncbi:DEAD/DEAH box helicase [Stigmatella erecta]|uniref:Helicase conserved C-terminal domain-containing protein n=1 Tax=Stigmatella erecta TaxID=83460 RepID=A0A1I0CMC9_9BACT|nr:DEAD/DEAH box helicase [Stigmatella erecta]SET20841.1 Helicase conserved C-terminal domain-containing protein [Stigmatella erecta]